MNVILDIYLSNDKSKTKGYSFQIYLILFIFFYTLFALDRIKRLLSFTVDGVTITNQIWLVPLIYLLSIIINREEHNLLFFKYNFYLRACLFLYMLVIIIGGFNAISIEQYIYATFLFIVPISLFFMASNLTIDDINLLFKIIVITCLFYAVFTIILTTNYAFFMNLVGNPTDNYRYYSQYRASMMLGSSITVSYYFNLTLPICFYLFFTINDGKWKVISAITIVVNIAASFILLSRAATLCTILIIMFYFLFVKGDTTKKARAIILIVLMIAMGIYVLQNYDLSRLMRRLDSSDSSVSGRLTASNLGLYIFKKYPIFGSGMGRYFRRVYSDRYITVDGFIGLIDPHNMYVLVLSETGLIGLVLVGIMFLILFRSFSNIKEKVLRQTAYITLFAFLFDAMGGSHLFNEISYSIIFWIYMGIFNAISIKDRMNIANVGFVN